MQKNVLLIKYGEIFIRGKNKPKFYRKLADTILNRLGPNYIVIREQSRFVVEPVGDGGTGFGAALDRLKNTPGITSVCPAIKTDDLSIENLRGLALSHMVENYPAATFKVEARRSDKKYPMDSMQIAADVGGYIFNSGNDFSVDVIKPDIVLRIELRSCAYIYSKEIKGISGLPVGSSGKATLLLSGGIDSPVAGYLISKRGVSLEAVYFHSPPYTSLNSIIKVKDLCEKLSVYTGEIKLNVINFTEVMLYIKNNAPEDKMTIFLKRSMLKAAGALAEKNGSEALVVGDSVAQVASQTLKAIAVIDQAVVMPVLRPLCAFNKDDIINIAKEIGTFEISIRPFNDCCTVFVPKFPDTKPEPLAIQKINEGLNGLSLLIEKAIEAPEAYAFKF